MTKATELLESMSTILGTIEEDINLDDFMFDEAGNPLEEDGSFMDITEFSDVDEAVKSKKDAAKPKGAPIKISDDMVTFIPAKDLSPKAKKRLPKGARGKYVVKKPKTSIRFEYRIIKKDSKGKPLQMQLWTVPKNVVRARIANMKKMRAKAKAKSK